MFNLGSMLSSGSLPELAESVRRTLSAVQAQVGTAWGVQHNADGTHANVTATSMRAGQIGANGLYTVDYTVAYGVSPAPLEIPAGVSVVQLKVILTHSMTIFGIRQVGQQYGDILFIGPAQGSTDSIFLVDRANASSSTPLGTEIAFDASITNSTATPKQFWVSTAASPTMLIYLPGRGSNNADAWCIPQMTDRLST